MIAWPDGLIRDLARKRAVLFLGAGVSANSIGAGGLRPPVWREFLIAALGRCNNPRKHIQGLLREGDYLTACEIIRNRMEDEWIPFLQEKFVAPQYAVASIHEHLYGIGSNIVLTPNFDKIYDNFAQQQSTGTIPIKTYADNDLAYVVRGDSPVVIKIHGTIDNPGDMVFSRSDYIKLKRDFSSILYLIDALFVTHTFLFVGCGLSDPDLHLFLEKAVQVFPGSAPHYITLPKPVHPDLVESIKKNWNLRVLSYSSKDSHQELTDSIKDLVDRVDQKRAEIGATQRW